MLAGRTMLMILTVKRTGLVPQESFYVAVLGQSRPDARSRIADL